MASKTEFAPAEWKKLMQAPLLAGLAVRAADPNGFIATLRESFYASMRSLDAANDNDGALVEAVAEALLTSGGRADAREGVRTIVQCAGHNEIREKALEALKEAAEIVDAKAPSEAKAFRAWLARIAQIVAEDHGQFLGFRDVEIIDAQKATLSEICAALNVQSGRGWKPYLWRLFSK